MCEKVRGGGLVVAKASHFNQPDLKFDEVPAGKFKAFRVIRAGSKASLKVRTWLISRTVVTRLASNGFWVTRTNPPLRNM